MTWKDNAYLPHKKKKLCSDPKKIVFWFFPLHPDLHRKKGNIKHIQPKKIIPCRQSGSISGSNWGTDR